MCSGISGLFAIQAVARSPLSQLPMALTYNFGRILSYAILGAVVATFGSTLFAAIPAIAAPVRLLSGLIIVLIGLQIAFNWRILKPIERMGGVLWQKIVPAAQGLIPVSTLPRALGLGLLWGFLPCGLVYSVLLIAAMSADTLSGGAIMIAFGLGTLPAMLLTGIGAVTLTRFFGRSSTRLAAGLLIVIAGVLTLAMPVSSMFSPDSDTHPHHGQHSMLMTGNHSNA
jgi:sulfite exporter TauE/SafE